MAADDEPVHTGSCLCGGVRFRIRGALAPIQICHCSQCRKAQGAAFASNIPVAAQAFELVQGRELLREFESSPGKKRVFCQRCGSPVFSRRDAKPDTLRLRAGLIDEPLHTRPAAQFYTAYRASWYDPHDDDVASFPEAL